MIDVRAGGEIDTRNDGDTIKEERGDSFIWEMVRVDSLLVSFFSAPTEASGRIQSMDDK